MSSLSDSSVWLCYPAFILPPISWSSDQLIISLYFVYSSLLLPYIKTAVVKCWEKLQTITTYFSSVCQWKCVTSTCKYNTWPGLQGGFIHTFYPPQTEACVFFFSFLLVHHFSDSEWTVIHHNGRQAEGKWGLTCVCVYMHVCVCVCVNGEKMQIRTYYSPSYFSFNQQQRNFPVSVSTLCRPPPLHHPHHPLFLPESYQVPTILNALQRSVQAVLVGKIQIQDWFGNGIKRAALMNKWVLKEVAIDEDERCLLQTDGSFLYLLCKDGLYKVGSGYSGTVRVCNTYSCMFAMFSKTIFTYKFGVEIFFR